MGLDHFLRIESGEERTILEDNFPDVQLFAVTVVDKNFKAIIHLLSTSYVPEGFTTAHKKKLVVKAANFTLIVGQLYKMGPDEILCRCVFKHEQPWIMSEAHASVIGGHYARKETVHKILQAGLWWPTIHMDTKKFCRSCDVSQRTGKPLRRDEMSLALIFLVL